MFEQEMHEDILCGVIEENGEYAPVYCKPLTGECYFPDPVMSYNRLISELSVGDPIPVEFSDVVRGVEEGAFGPCLGVIYDGETLLKLLTDDFAIRVPVDNPVALALEKFTIDLYADYDED